MIPKQKHSNADELQIMQQMWSPDITHDPLNFVMFAFPWGEKGTPLEHFHGPRQWQMDELEAMRVHIVENENRMLCGERPKMLKAATASGRGIGKSALVAWQVLWMMTCHIGSTTIVTANTETQLKSRTWAELGKWHTLLKWNSHWFQKAALSLTPAPWFGDAVKDQLKIDTTYYYAQAQLWTEDNPDAFAGAHNPLGLLLIMDEASGIPEPIYRVSNGFFTEPVLHRYWKQYSNARRNSGGFYNSFHKNRDDWTRRHIDTREVEGVDLAEVESWVKAYGEDSDMVRVEVRGLFPRQGDTQFIASSVVEEARAREPEVDKGAPLVLGVDVARFGDDKSVICARQGRDARSIAWKSYKGIKTTTLANEVAMMADQLDPEAIFVDGGGIGGAVVDILGDRGYRVHEVQFGSKADEADKWMNKRTEIWARMRDWLNRGSIPADNEELADDLTAPEYRMVGDNSQVRLETKEEMKKRDQASPDWGDALAVTFAGQVARRDMNTGKRRRRGRSYRTDYEVM